MTMSRPSVRYCTSATKLLIGYSHPALSLGPNPPANYVSVMSTSYCYKQTGRLLKLRVTFVSLFARPAVGFFCRIKNRGEVNGRLGFSVSAKKGQKFIEIL
jgi:hypothetical protein